jgi:hypothetical protein
MLASLQALACDGRRLLKMQTKVKEYLGKAMLAFRKLIVVHCLRVYDSHFFPHNLVCVPVVCF